MNIWNVRCAAKENVQLGKWSSGKMPKSAFPLSKARTRFYRLGNAFTWRVITFDAAGQSYRLLVAYRTDKEQFSAILGVDAGGDTKVVARLEFHGTHGGWHLHYAKDDLSSVPAGVRAGPWVQRYECGAHGSFGLQGLSDDAVKSKAVTMVSDVFGLNGAGGMI